jgi:hypothetical protein
VRVLDVALPRDPDRPEPDVRDTSKMTAQDWRGFFHERHRVQDGVVEARIAVLSRLLHEGLRATPQMLLERAAQAQARLGGVAMLADNSGPAELHRVSAILLAAAVALPGREREDSLRRIADAARFVFCRKRVAGSRWSNAGGCGSQPELEPGEEDDDGMFACGMGHVPEKSQRFLDFLTRDATWRKRS